MESAHLPWEELRQAQRTLGQSQDRGEVPGSTPSPEVIGVTSPESFYHIRFSVSTGLNLVSVHCN